MYYGRENDIAVRVADELIGTYSKESDYSRALAKVISTVLGICPPFSATVYGGKLCGILKVSFFNEFDSRTITTEKMRTIIAAMGYTKDHGSYEVVEEYITDTSLCVSYRKK